jgi:hypothetical protein
MFFNNYLSACLIQGAFLSDPSAPTTAQICASTVLLWQTVGDEKVEVWIGFDGIIFM